MEGHTVVDLCAGHPRHRHAYISSNHTIQITINTEQDHSIPSFVLKYEGNKKYAKWYLFNTVDSDIRTTH